MKAQNAARASHKAAARSIVHQVGNIVYSPKQSERSILGRMLAVFRKLRDAYQHPSLTLVRRIIAAVVGSTVLLIGVALLILPGPAFIVIPLGLAILASEFVWARHLLRRAKSLIWREKTVPVASPPSQTNSAREEVTADKP